MEREPVKTFNKLEPLGTTLLLVTAIYFLVYLFPIVNSLDKPGHILVFYGSKIAPLTVMGFYLLSGISKVKTAFSTFSIGFFGFATFSLPLIIVSWFASTPLSFYLSGYAWSYAGLIEWAFCFVATYWLALRVTGQNVFALTFSTQALVVGGVIYEFPVGNLFHTDIYFSTFYPLFIATFWFSLAFMVMLLREKRWHPTWLFYGLLVLFVGFSVFYAFNPFFNIWLPRLPTILLLSTLPLGIRRGEKL